MRERTVHGLLDQAARRTPEAVAVSDATGSWTYTQLRRHSVAFAGWLTAQQVAPGDRVLVRLENVREFLAILYGTLRHGAVLVPINPAMKPYQLASVVADSTPEVIIAHGEDDVFQLPDFAGQVLDIADVWADLPEVTSCDDSATGADDLGLLIYTSGSTSTPKAVMSPHRAITFATYAIAERLSYRQDDLVLTAIPLSFDYGLYQILLCALAGAELVLVDERRKLRLMSVLRAKRVTVVPVVPSLAQMLVALAGRDDQPNTVRLFTNTGAALLPPLIAELRTAFPGARIALMYGTTECKRISVLEPDGDLAKPGSVGRALTGTQVVILDENGAVLPAGSTGEIAVRGPHVMNGYWGAPEQTAQRYRRGDDGTVTLHTGDFGSMDADGHLYFSGRRDDLFKRHGVRVSGLEIEAAAKDIPGVRMAAVVPPQPDTDLTVFVVSDLKPDAVLAELGHRLEAAKVPDVCRALPEFPLTANGKTDYRALSALTQEGAAR